MVRILSVLLAFLLTLAAANSIAAVGVAVFPDTPNIAESFRIIFTADEKINGEPDFSPLEPLFDILGQNQSTQVQWINGKHSATTRWELEVIAKKPGDLVIPAIDFGSSSSHALSISVIASGASGTSTNDDLLLEISIDDDRPYVQQQTILTVRLLRRISLADAKLTEPATSGDVIIKPLSKDRTYQDERNGKRYEVFERRFALYPQASGRLAIEPFTVTTQVTRGSRSLFDPFRSSTTTRRVRSNALTLEVEAIPRNFSGDNWLPARKLDLREEWEPENNIITNGEPITRTLYLWSDGLTAGQLPDFPTLDIDSTTVYPDQVQTREQENEAGFSAIKQQKFALITKFDNADSDPNITIPAIEIPWWNIETDTMEVARLPARKLSVNVNAAAATSPEAITPAERVSDNDLESSGESTIVLEEPRDGIWRGVAIAAILGWLATAVLAWRFVRNHGLNAKRSRVTSSEAENPKLARLEKDVSHAARANDPYAARQSLLAWGRAAHAQEIRSLGHLARLVAPELATEIRRLDAHFYAQGDASWLGSELLNAFKNNKISDKSKAVSGRKPDGLESLFKLA